MSSRVSPSRTVNQPASGTAIVMEEPETKETDTKETDTIYAQLKQVILCCLFTTLVLIFYITYILSFCEQVACCQELERTKERWKAIEKNLQLIQYSGARQKIVQKLDEYHLAPIHYAVRWNNGFICEKLLSDDCKYAYATCWRSPHCFPRDACPRLRCWFTGLRRPNSTARRSVFVPYWKASGRVRTPFANERHGIVDSFVFHSLSGSFYWSQFYICYCMIQGLMSTLETIKGEHRFIMLWCGIIWKLLMY